MDPREAMQLLQQMGIGPEQLPQLVAAINALAAAGMIPDEGEEAHSEEAAPAEADPYRAQIAKQLAGGADA